MSILGPIAKLVKDPAPSYVFEFSETGVAFAHDRVPGFEPLPEGAIRPSPLEDNLVKPDVVAGALRKIAPPNGARKRAAAVILPDYAARVSVLDFDSFPSAAEEQAQLVRFRVKKTVPFDIDAASVGFFAQPAGSAKKIEVVAVTVAIEILAKYEALFRNANFHPGEVTTSTLSALNLYRESGVAVIAKLAGKTLTVAVASLGKLKLFRCLALEEGSEEEILGVLYPTFAYVED